MRFWHRLCGRKSDSGNSSLLYCPLYAKFLPSRMLQDELSTSCRTATAPSMSTTAPRLAVHKSTTLDSSTANPTSSGSSMIANRYEVNPGLAPVMALCFKVEESTGNLSGSNCPSNLVADEKSNNLLDKAEIRTDRGREADSKENHPANLNKKGVSCSSSIDDPISNNRQAKFVTFSAAWGKTTFARPTVQEPERADVEIWRESAPWDCLSGFNSVPVHTTHHMPALRVRSNHTAAKSKDGTQISCKAGSNEAPGCFDHCAGTQQTAWTTALAAVTTACSAQLEDFVRPPEAIGAAMGPRQSWSRATRRRQGVNAVEGSLQQLVVAGCDLSPAGKDAADPYPVTFDPPSASTAACLRANSKGYYRQRSGRVCALSRTVSWVSVARVLVLAILAQLCQVTLADTYTYNVPDTEIAALQDLYDATNGDSWTWSSTGNQWNFTDPNPCYDHWQGINCTQVPSDGFLHVLAVKLPVFGLAGSIPDSLAELTQLTLFDLDTNQLTGTIPDSLQHLTQLTELNLEGNRLAGAIPASLGQLAQLQLLGLGYNQLTGTIPVFLGQLTRLHILSIDDNQLTGTIPESLQQLTILTQLYLDTNHLTGTIPASLGQLMQINFLFLQANELTGIVPKSFEHLTQMIFFDVSDNWLTGAIGGVFSQLTRIFSFRMESNLLTGTIPAYLGQLPTLTVLELGFNRFTGSIPQNWSAAATMLVLYLNENHLSGTIPESLGYMPLLLSLNLSSNHLTGTIPASFQQLGSLQVLMLHDNELRGSIVHLFSSHQSNLSTVQLSGNRLTGTLPDAAFLLPGLTSFAAVDNCFEGTLPVDSICSSASLNALVLDGLHSAPSCERGASLSHQAFKLGSLPACLLTMLGLTTLHLSGSGLTGSLPADANISAVLRDLSLSHNLLTGKMPDNILRRDWAKLDLSYSRLTGTLHGARAAPYSNSTELYLQHNRLSGVIPGSMQHVGSLSLLEDNMFSCRVDRSDVPQQDSDSDKYTCGSDAVNNALYVWLGAALAAALAAGSVVWQRQIQGRLHDWFSAVNTAATPKLRSIFQAAELLVGVGAGAAAYCVLVLLPVYAVVSAFHPKFTYEYAWTVSGVFLSGTAAFAVEATFLLAQLLICGFVTELLLSQAPAAILFPHGTVPTAITKGTKDSAARVAVVLLSLVVVTGINAGFVVATLHLNGRELTVIQILLAIFKLGYNNIVAPALQNRITDAASKHEVTASMLLLVLLNVIVIPCLVVMVISPACFYDAIAGSDPVTSDFRYGGSCQVIVLSTDGKVTCEGFATEVGTTTYTPPFTYSYQCSSSFVTSYAPTFVIMCIISGFVLPALHVLLLWLRCNMSPTSCLYSVVNSVTPSILMELRSEQDLAQARRDPLYEPVFNANQLVMSLLTYLALLLTFGALFPPLALCCAVAMAVMVLTARLEVGRYLAAAVDAGRKDCLEEVESACVGVATPQQLRMALGLILAVSCTFYTLFLFDTLGDAVGFAGAFWVLIVVPLLPVVALCLFRAAGMRRGSLAGQAEIESNVDPEVGMELNSTPGAADSSAAATGNIAKGEPDDVPSSCRVNRMHAP